MVLYPLIVTPGKNPALPSEFTVPVNPWHTLTLLDSFKQYNNAIETNYIALAAALTAITATLVSHIGTAGGGLSTPLTPIELIEITAAIDAIGAGASDAENSPGGPLRPAISGAMLTTQTILDLTTGPTSLITFAPDL